MTITEKSALYDRVALALLMVTCAVSLICIGALLYDDILARAEWPAVCADLAIAAECIARLGEGL